MEWRPIDEENDLFLEMVELVSYWRSPCSSQVVIEAGALKQRSDPSGGKICILNGLGEFFYVNKITEADPEGFMEMVCALGEEGRKRTPWLCKETGYNRLWKGVLVPCRRWKRFSAVTLELLKSADACFRFISLIQEVLLSILQSLQIWRRPCDQCTSWHWISACSN